MRYENFDCIKATALCRHYHLYIIPWQLVIVSFSIYLLYRDWVGWVGGWMACGVDGCRISFDRNMYDHHPACCYCYCKNKPYPKSRYNCGVLDPKVNPPPFPCPLPLTNNHSPRNGSSTWAVNVRPSTISHSTSTLRRTSTNISRS